MPSPTTFALFSRAALAPAVVPRPAVTHVVTQSFDKGRGAGLVCSRVPPRTRRLPSGGVFVALGVTAAAAHRPA